MCIDGKTESSFFIKLFKCEKLLFVVFLTPFFLNLLLGNCGKVYIIMQVAVLLTFCFPQWKHSSSSSRTHLRQQNRPTCHLRSQ